MPRVEFEPTIPVFEQVKAVQALDRAATVIGRESYRRSKRWIGYSVLVPQLRGVVEIK
jgi:hypothetical protein